MKIRSLLFFIAFFCSALNGKAQLTEKFSDGNFSAAPYWTGSSADWIVNAAFQLQSNNMVANSTSYLSTASALAISAEWEAYVNLSFNTSSVNYTDIFLTASDSDLTKASTSGYFVRIGGTDDEICLYRKNSAGVITKIIDGTNGITSTSNNAVKIKVTSDAAGQWTLYRDITGTGNSFLREGSVTDTTFNTSSFFGILIKQSTTGFFHRHIFDDIIVKPYTPDITPPVILSATVLSAHTIDILFNEPIGKSSSEPLINYTADNLLGTPAAVELDSNDAALVHLTFTSDLKNGMKYQLTINNITDLAGNSIVNGLIGFIYSAPYIPGQYDVVIDEIMADPAPQVSLPGNEWIELKNTCSSAINLKGWKIGDATSQSGPMPGFILLPDSMVTICATASERAMTVFGPVISVTGFPSLDNGSDQLVLSSPQNTIIHSVSYKESWYRNELKKAGGWSLEMIDTRNPCAGFSNWTASTDIKGGSPAVKNAVNAVNPDITAPKLLRAYAIDSLNIMLVFDETIDSLKAAATANFSISSANGIVTHSSALPPLFDRVLLNLNMALLHNKIYTVTVTAVTDCVGNAVSNKSTARVGLSEVAAASDIVINEVLFNPRPGGVDYVEIYNRSKKIIDLKQTYIANRNNSGVLSNITQLSTENNLLFPGDFSVITENAALVTAAYVAKDLNAFVEPGSMPAFNDDKGTVVILNAQGEITDQLAYDEDWHFKLISNREGVSLERVDYDASTQSRDNWQSAATSIGYGTPTYKNSQYRINAGVQGEIKLTPEIVSPDSDGQDDFATLDFSFREPGYIANITIFDGSGRSVRYLQRNALCGTKGSFRWDGLGEKNQQLAIGVYVVVTEIFNLKGNKKQFRNAIVLARRN